MSWRKVLRMTSRKENFRFPLSMEFSQIIKTNCYSVSSISVFYFYFIWGTSTTSLGMLVDILRTRPTTLAPKNIVIEYLQQQGSFVFTFKVLKHLEQVTRDEIKRLGGNPKLEQFMELLYCPDFHSPRCTAWLSNVYDTWIDITVIFNHETLRVLVSIFFFCGHRLSES